MKTPPFPKPARSIDETLGIIGYHADVIASQRGISFSWTCGKCCTGGGGSARDADQAEQRARKAIDSHHSAQHPDGGEPDDGIQEKPAPTKRR